MPCEKCLPVIGCMALPYVGWQALLSHEQSAKHGATWWVSQTIPAAWQLLRRVRAQGGNDFEIFSSPKTVGHTVTSPTDTIEQCTKLFMM